MRRVIVWTVILVIVLAGTLALLGPDHTSLPFLKDGASAQLVRDDHELGVFFQRGSWVTSGLTPYDASIFQEYPQFGLSYITLPYIFSDQFGYYRWALISVNIALMVLLLFVSYRLLSRLGHSFWYLGLLVLPSMLYFTFSRFDVLVALLVNVVLLCVLSRRWRTAGIILGIAILTKWYPIIFLPLIYLYITRVESEQPRRTLRSLLVSTALLVFGVMAVSFAVDGFTSLRPYLFHGARTGGVGSLYFMLIQGPLLSTGVEQLNYLGLTIFLLLQFSVPIIAIIKSGVVRRWLGTPRQLILWMTLAVVIFTLFSRFYSPQWIVWLIPLLLMVADKKLALLAVGYDVLNYLAFPLIWQVWGPFSLGYNAVSIIIIIALLLIIWRLLALLRHHTPYAPA